MIKDELRWQKEERQNERWLDEIQWNTKIEKGGGEGGSIIKIFRSIELNDLLVKGKDKDQDKSVNLAHLSGLIFGLVLFPMRKYSRNS